MLKLTRLFAERLKASTLQNVSKVKSHVLQVVLGIEEHMIYWCLCLQVFWVTKITLLLIVST
jgi:hypothetical protein